MKKQTDQIYNLKIIIKKRSIKNRSGNKIKKLEEKNDKN